MAGHRGRSCAANVEICLMIRKDPGPALLKQKRSAKGRMSKNKGASFERLTGSMLSEWITHGERRDLFSRNVLSGGRFTNQAKAGDYKGIPGDLMAASPLAFDFLSKFLVECKHYKDLNLHSYLMDERAKSFLGSVIKQTADQAYSAGLLWMVIAKQNALPTLLFLPRQAVAIQSAGCPYHALHNGNVYMYKLERFLIETNPQEYLKSLKKVFR
jgi:hypothetical protein